MPKLTTSSSKRLIQEAQTGDSDAIGRFSEKYWGLVVGWAKNYPMQGVDPEDVAQNVWIRVILNLKTYNPEMGRFRSWLGTITRNCALDLREDQKNSGEAKQSFGDPDELGKLVSKGFEEEETAFDARELSESSSLVFDALKENFEEDVWFCFVGMVVLGLTAKQIGDELVLKPATVRKRKQRVIERLPGLLEEANEPEE